MASSRRVRIIIEVDTDLPLEILETISYAETKRPDRHWFEPVGEQKVDEDGDTDPFSIAILHVTAEEVR